MEGRKHRKCQDGGHSWVALNGATRELSGVDLIDSHVHLYPPELNAAPRAWADARGEGIWARLCLRTRSGGRRVQGLPSLDELLRAMDRAGVAGAILQGWYWESEASCRVHNRFLAACARAHPDRLRAFAALQPAGTERDVRRQLEAARDDGFVGVGELCPHAQGSAGGGAGLRTVFETAGIWNWPVCLHVTDPASKPYPGRIETPLADFVAWAGEHPGTRLILAHWGGGLDVRPFPNVWVDTAAAPLIYGTSAWDHLGRTVTDDRVLFGSDYPLVLRPSVGEEPEVATFVEEMRERLGAGASLARIAGGNARGLFSPG
jgi:uncharacterized protein